MRKTVIVLMVVVMWVVLTATAMTAPARSMVTRLPIPAGFTIPATMNLASTCVLQLHNDTADSYYGSFASGDRVAIHIDPSICADTTYPFNIEGIYVSLYGDSGAVWPVDILVEIWSVASGGACNGPKSLLYSETFALDSVDFAYPSVGGIPFSDTVCVTAPLYAAVRYTGGSATPYPSILFDSDLPGDSCANWAFATGYGWYKWSAFWSDPIPGNAIIWVQGETLSALCSSSCCVGSRGNVNMSGITDLTDLSALVSYLTAAGYVLPCVDAANVNGFGIVDLTDLSALVSYLTGSGYTLPSCP